MKFESFLLRGLFVVCLVLCAATVGSMLFGTSIAAPASPNQVVEATTITPLACPLLPDGVLCIRAN
ncbi:hypothetical protein [Oleiagrimonas soli]|uniref:Uncharacterized protein n=1 Tax=Oleiagrimonas soli TaxID=1543381 RepID=A0A099CZT5_9GAMM|nr:hypothetical protein [Oleiagrimonas soli]KGI79087.1 hypothetical protein LF63_0100940 [Oleiagrimonas soli]MBB6184704.1 hypothetical protein [Oleiagrimonas soli]